MARYENDRIIKFYENFDEGARLKQGAGQLEFYRSMEIFKKYLPKPPVTILDIGGADGVYSLALAKLGYEMHLIDLTPSNVEKARKASEGQSEYPITTCTVGDARKLEWDDNSVDVVLMMGPMYHLLERDDRIAALKESLRVLKDGGLIFATVIPRYASALDGLFHGFLDDPNFERIVKRDLETGRHTNPTEDPNYFTDSYFHKPDELNAEIVEAGFRLEKLIPVEGPLWMLSDFSARWDEPASRKKMLDVLDQLENEYWMLAVSSHIMAVAYK
jgi:ubiquinone/menaquinone biosynthesis C-methylase UbiE